MTTRIDPRALTRELLAFNTINPPGMKSGIAAFVAATVELITFSADGAFLEAGNGGPPAVILGPGEPKLAHQTDESCCQSRIEQSVDVFATLMRRWCGI